MSRYNNLHLGSLYSDGACQRERNRENSQLAFGPNPPLWGMVMHQPNLCGKWLVRFARLSARAPTLTIFQVLETLLLEWHQDQSNKVLIFTKSIKLLEILQFRLQARSESFE
jgi:DNA excision repair protein ERCC-6-like 2